MEMEDGIVLIHAGLVFLLMVYLLVRLIATLINSSNVDRSPGHLRRLRITDRVFVTLILISGVYPVVMLDILELYHLLKLTSLLLIAWLLWFSGFRFVYASLTSVLLLVGSSYMSLTNKPTFPRDTSSFDQRYPEFSQLPENKKGEFIFSRLCITCHGKDGRKGHFGAADLSQSKLDVEEKREIIRNGSPLTVMAPFKKVLSDEEIDHVVDYVDKMSDN